MAWPQSQEYNEAIQNPASSFLDPDLRQGQPVTNALGLPIARSGNFADVYEIFSAHGYRSWAVKCFTREMPGLRDRYRNLSAHLASVKLPCTVEFQYLEQGIRVHGHWYPVLKMAWVKGLTLNEFVKNALDQPNTLGTLADSWLRLARDLREAQLAHSDLQHGNVLLAPDGNGSFQLLLIDYDGTCVPALADKQSGEVGHPAYQHPQRLREGTYNLDVDRFSHLVIYTAVRCLSVAGRPLWERYDNGDNLLFREEDFQAPERSPLFQELWQQDRPEVRSLVGNLLLACQGRLEQVPLLQDLIRDGQVRPLTATEETQVQEALRNGAANVRTVPKLSPVSTRQTTTSSPWWLSHLPGAAPANVPTRPQPWLPPLDWRRWTYAVLGFPIGLFLIWRRRTWTRPQKCTWAGISLACWAVIVLLARFTLWLVNPTPLQDLVTLRGHEGVVHSVAISADGKRIVSAGRDGKVRVWDASTRSEVVTLSGTGGDVTSVAMSADGKRIVHASANKPMKVWEPDTAGTTIPIKGCADNVRQVAISANGKRIVSADVDGHVQVWDADTGTAIFSLQGDLGPVTSVAISADGTRVVTGSHDGTLEVWDGEKGIELHLLMLRRPIVCLAISADGTHVVIGGEDGVVELWDSERSFLYSRNADVGYVSQVAISGDGTRFVSAGADGMVKVWDVERGTLLRSSSGHTAATTCVAIAGNRIVSASWDGVVRVWGLAAER